MRVGAHAAAAPGRARLELRDERARFVEQFIWLVTLEPALELLEVGWVVVQAGEGDLVGPPEPFLLMPIDFLRPRPSLGGAQHDHRPARTLELSGLASLLLDAADIQDAFLERRGHALV